MDEKMGEVQSRLKPTEEKIAMREIVTCAGGLVQRNPDKFRVVRFDSTADNFSIEVFRARTILVFEDGNITLELTLRKEDELPEQSLRVYMGSGLDRKSIYRLDITRGEDGQDKMVDRFAETKVTARSIVSILKSYDEIRLPDSSFGNPLEPILQEFLRATKRQNGKDSGTAKLLS